MANGPMYQKYGVRTHDPSALIAGQAAVTKGFQDAIGGIQGLLDKTESNYRQENTLNLQAYLQDRVQREGLGASPLDRVGIQQRFGNMVNMEEIEAADKTARSEILKTALGSAAGAAGASFKDSEDLAVAGDAFKQSLMQAGMNEVDATQHMSSWRTDNQYLAEDVKIRDNKIVSEATTAMVQGLRSSDLSFEEVSKGVVDQLPPKLQKRALLSLREDYDALSKMTPEQLDEYETNVSRIDTQLAAAEEQLDLGVQQAKSRYDAIQVTSPATVSALGSLSAQLGGVNGAIGADAKDGMIAGLVGMLNSEKMTGPTGAVYFKEKVNELIQDRGMTPQDAGAIMLQTYNDLSGSDGMLEQSQIDYQMNMYLGLHDQKQSALSNYNAVQKAASSRRATLTDQGISLKSDLRRGERRSNVTGNPFDSAQAFKSSVFGRGSLDTSTPAPASEKKAPKPEKPASRAAALMEQVEANRQKVVTSREGLPAGNQASESRQEDVTATFKGNLNSGGRMVGGRMVSEEAFRAANDEVGDAILSGLAAPVTKPLRAFHDFSQNRYDEQGRPRSLFSGGAPEQPTGDPLAGIRERLQQEGTRPGPTNQAALDQADPGLDLRQKLGLANDAEVEKTPASILRGLSKIPPTEDSAQEQAATLTKYPPDRAKKALAILSKGNPVLAQRVAELLGLV